MRPFVHLHLHTQYSLLCGAVRLKDLFKRIGHLNMPAVAMTDRNNLFGAIDFQGKARKAGVKPIIGSEMYFVPSLNEKGPRFHLVCLAYNEKGYESLRYLSSRSYLEGLILDEPHIDFQMLKEHHEGLIVLSGG